MSEIEKLYKKAGIEYGSCQNYSRFEQCCNSPFCDSGMCPDGTSGEKHPFTAEKELELIIFIINKFGTLTFFNYVEFTKEVMAEKIAKLLNNRWQYLSDILKQQIKEILE